MRLRDIVLCSSVLFTVIAFAGVAPAQQTFNDKDTAALQRFKLTVDEVKHLTAAVRALEKVVKHDPSLLNALAGPDEKELNLENAVRHLESNAKISEALKSAGSSPREYVFASVALTLASAAADAKRANPADKTLPEVSEENLAFVLAHGKEVKEALAEMEKFASTGAGGA